MCKRKNMGILKCRMKWQYKQKEHYRGQPSPILCSDRSFPTHILQRTVICHFTTPLFLQSISYRLRNISPKYLPGEDLLQKTPISSSIMRASQKFKRKHSRNAGRNSNYRKGSQSIREGRGKHSHRMVPVNSPCFNAQESAVNSDAQPGKFR